MPSEAVPHGQPGYLPPSHGDKTIGAQIAGIAFDHPSRTALACRLRRMRAR